jgi:hypothetical protein
MDGQLYVWSIGIQVGRSLRDLSPPRQIANPVLSAHDVSDVAAAFVADPFMVFKDGLWHMFFEVFNTQNERGEIALATSRDGFKWEYRCVVLREPFHLSYPYVFSWEGEYYLVPETGRAGMIQMYRALSFPLRWELFATLIGEAYADSSIFRFNDRWWMFASPRETRVRDGNLMLFHSNELDGRWESHALNPIVYDNQCSARPAGRVLASRNHVIRFAQDKHRAGESSVRAFRVVDLTVSTYAEAEIEGGPILGPSGIGWNKCGMHHIDFHRLNHYECIACVDGVIRERAIELSERS